MIRGCERHIMKKSKKIQRLSTLLEYGCYAVILVSIGLCAYVSWGLYASPEETLALFPSSYRSLIERFMTLQRRTNESRSAAAVRRH